MQKDGLILKLVEKAGKASLTFTSEKASYWLVHQEEEPAGVKEFIKRRVK